VAWREAFSDNRPAMGNEKPLTGDFGNISIFLSFLDHHPPHSNRGKLLCVIRKMAEAAMKRKVTIQVRLDPFLYLFLLLPLLCSAFPDFSPLGLCCSWECVKECKRRSSITVRSSRPSLGLILLSSERGRRQYKQSAEDARRGQGSL
jgi:hypothetical protein